MGQQLRDLAALLADLSLVLSTHMDTNNYL